MPSPNQLAQALKALHVPGKPFVIANVWDSLSARAVAPLDSAKVLGTTSWSIARAHETDDDDLTLDMNFNVIENIGKVAQEFNKPLTVDIQDGYGRQLEKAVKGMIARGAAGCNIEDYNNYTQKVVSAEEAETRIKRTLQAAKEAGVPDFAVNARCDVLVHGGELAEVIQRGKRYLAAGATTVFVWGAARGVSKAEVVQMVEAFEGRLNVMLAMSGGLTVPELADLGVARISIGPQLQLDAMKHLTQAADQLLKGSAK